MNRKLNWIIAWQLVLSCLFLWGWTYTLKTNTPAGTDDPTEADDRIRETKAALVERLDVDHYFYPSATSTYDATDTGKHRYITFREPNDLTSMAADESALFSKDVSSVTELHWIDESDNVLQLTSGGTINIVSADLLGTLANNTYFTAVDAAGTGTVNLIKADANDVAVVPDNSQTATNAAPSSSTGIANKKYVDDQVKLLTYDNTQLFSDTAPTSYTDLDIATLASLTAQRMKVFLSVTTTTSGDKWFNFRPNGETAVTSTSTPAGTGNCQVGANEMGYIEMLTDTSGIIEWLSMSSSTNCTIKLLTWQKVN